MSSFISNYRKWGESHQYFSRIYSNLEKYIDSIGLHTSIYGHDDCMFFLNFRLHKFFVMAHSSHTFARFLHFSLLATKSRSHKYFHRFWSSSTLRGYFPITTFMTSIQIPIFFVTIKWHKFILPLTFIKEKCIYNKKIWDRKTIQRSCYKRVHTCRDHHSWIDNVWWGLCLDLEYL